MRVIPYNDTLGTGASNVARNRSIVSLLAVQD